MADRVDGGVASAPLISAALRWTDVYGYAQFLLERHPEARALVDEARRRRARAGVSSQSWSSVVLWSQRSRLVLDYTASVRRAARRMGPDLEHAVHELAGRDGYELQAPHDGLIARAPSPAVASKIAADLTNDESWVSGPVANRQARYRYVQGPRFESSSTFDL